MHRLETVDLGCYRGSDYFLTGFVEPEPAAGEDYDPDVDADGYGVVLARSTPIGSNVEIVRIDTAHGQPHLDLVYLPSDTAGQRKVWLDEEVTYERMKRYLLANWRRFVALSSRHPQHPGTSDRSSTRTSHSETTTRLPLSSVHSPWSNRSATASAS